MEFITKNSKKSIKIVPASFQNAIKLKTELFKCLVKNNFLEKIKDLKETDLKRVLGEIVNVLIEADTSEGFNKAIMECLSVCICDNAHALTEQYFNDCPALWEDYYEILSNCAEVNLRPFFKSLVSELQTRLGKLDELPQQLSPQMKV